MRADRASPSTSRLRTSWGSRMDTRQWTDDTPTRRSPRSRPTQYGVFSRDQARERGPHRPTDPIADRERSHANASRSTRSASPARRRRGDNGSWPRASRPAPAPQRRTAAPPRCTGTTGSRPGSSRSRCRTAAATSAWTGVIVHSSSYWCDEDIVVVDGIPVSTPERTLCTLAAVVSEAPGRERARQRRTRRQGPTRRRHAGARRRA